MSRAWRRFLSRAAIAVAVGLLIIAAPLPMWTPRWFAYFQVPVVVFLFVATWASCCMTRCSTTITSCKKGKGVKR